MASIIPGWNSVEAAARWHRGFEIAGFIALGLLLLFEVLAYIYGNRRDGLAIAREQAAARERSRQEEQANQQRNNEIAEATRKAAEAQDAGKQTAEQLAQSNKRVSELAKKAANRAITPEQRMALNAILSANPKYSVTIKSTVGDQESIGFAQQFTDIFRENGWTVVVLQAMSDPPPKGLQVSIRDGKNPPPGAPIVVSALEQAHMDFQTFASLSIEEGIIDFRVGSKP